jgi:hypothetical protein
MSKQDHWPKCVTHKCARWQNLAVLQLKGLCLDCAYVNYIYSLICINLYFVLYHSIYRPRTCNGQHPSPGTNVAMRWEAASLPAMLFGSAISSVCVGLKSLESWELRLIYSNRHSRGSLVCTAGTESNAQLERNDMMLRREKRMTERLKAAHWLLRIVSCHSKRALVVSLQLWFWNIMKTACVSSPNLRQAWHVFGRT